MDEQQAYKVVDPDAPVRAFGDEAERRWNTGSISHDSTTVAAALLISLANSSQGLQEAADRYMAHALSMANHLGLFGPPTDVPTDLDAESAARLKADSHVAWGLFNYTT